MLYLISCFVIMSAGMKTHCPNRIYLKSLCTGCPQKKILNNFEFEQIHSAQYSWNLFMITSADFNTAQENQYQGSQTTLMLKI